MRKHFILVKKKLALMILIIKENKAYFKGNRKLSSQLTIERINLDREIKKYKGEM